MKTMIYTQEEVIETVTSLTVSQLNRFLEAECVMPQQSDNGNFYTASDLARLELLCEFSEDLDLDENTLSLMMSLIDQVHGMRRQMRLLVNAIEAEPEEVRARIKTTLSEMG